MSGQRRLLLAAALVAAFVACLGLAGCGGSETRPVDPTPPNPFAAFAVGRDDAFEVATWNLRNFATDAGADEVALAAQAIRALGCDLVAVQEIAESGRFNELLAQLPDHSGVQATSDRYQNLGFVWLDSTVTLNSLGEIRPQMDNASRPFPRWPLVVEITWRGHDLAVINNHYKCCGDGTLQAGDPDDEETRRLEASEILDQHIRDAYPDQAVILLGDLNDRLDDVPANNIFSPFLARPEEYRFADLAVATGPSTGWSWGPGSSHLDHILVTAPLFPAVEAAGASCATVRLDQALRSGEYRDLLSDHAPVVLVLPGALLP
ncbi:MAG: endonuclease/exonuclease/phosphatase family protein [Candidatus Krumholzibacteriia bacterium]